MTIHIIFGAFTRIGPILIIIIIFGITNIVVHNGITFGAGIVNRAQNIVLQMVPRPG